MQLAHISGYKVVSTASPRNFELVKARGADVMLDYRDADVVAKIKAAAGDAIENVLDTISEKDSQRISAASIHPDGGNLVLLLAKIDEAINRSDVETQSACTPLPFCVQIDDVPQYSDAAVHGDRA